MNRNGGIPSDRDYFSTAEIAQLLGVSRIAVFKRIRLGQIKAERVGRSYIIPREEFVRIMGLFVSPEKKRAIETAVKKAANDYREVLKKLGKE